MAQGQQAHFDRRLIGRSFRDCVSKVGYHGASYFMAEYMHGIVEHSRSATRDRLFWGSIKSCAIRLWGGEHDGETNDFDRKNIASVLKLNGFEYRGLSATEPRWYVPEILPFPWAGLRGEGELSQRKPDEIKMPAEEPVSSTWMCTACPAVSESREERDAHMAETHSSTTTRSPSESLEVARERLKEPWTCDVCGFHGTLSTKGTHMRSHRPTKLQLSFLELVKAEPGHRNGHYAEKMGRSPAAISGLVAALKKFDLVNTTGTRSSQQVWPGTEAPPGVGEDNDNGKKSGGRTVVVQQRAGSTPRAHGLIHDVCQVIEEFPNVTNQDIADYLNVTVKQAGDACTHLRKSGRIVSEGTKGHLIHRPQLPSEESVMAALTKEGTKPKDRSMKKPAPAPAPKRVPNGEVIGERVYLLDADGTLTLAVRVGEIEGTPIFKADALA